MRTRQKLGATAPRRPSGRCSIARHPNSGAARRIRQNWRRSTARKGGALLALLLALCGCGPDGPQRYDLSGEVLFQGEPVAAGIMIFEPDPSRGNAGPPALALIEEGYYATPRGEGTVGGPHIVRIVAGTGEQAGPLRPYGIPYLPDEYRTPVDLPRADATHDFELSPTEDQ